MAPPSAVERHVRRLATALASALLLFTGCTQALSAGLLLAGADLHVAVLPLSLAAAIAGLWLLTREWDVPASPRLWALTIALLLVVVTLSVAIASAVHDVSFDGQTYQQEGVLQLARGWNPLWDGPAAVRQLWPVDHYPKGAWLLGAPLYLLTGAIESAKAFTLVFIATAWAVTLAACLHLRPGCGVGVALAVAGLVALNPVATTQWTGFFVDGQLACLLGTVVACMALAWVNAGRWPLVLLSVALALLMATKFTGLVYGVTLASAYAGTMASRRGFASLLPAARWMTGGLALGVFVIGANPYVTNTLRHGHPLYPLAGPGAIDVMEAQRPAGFDAANPLVRLVRSTFARSERVTAPDAPTPKFPLAVAVDEFRSFAVADVRAAGFGPLFAAGLVLAALIWLGMWRQDAATAGWTTVVAGGLLLSALINPEAWWARFAPQLWLVPTVVAFGSAYAHAGPTRWASRVLIGLLVIDAGGIAVVHAQASIGRTRVVRTQMLELAMLPQPLRVHFGSFYSNRVRLQEYGIRYVDMDQLRCARIEALAYSQTRVCTVP